MGETILGVGVLCWGDQTKKSNQTPRVINPFTIYTYKELVYNPKCQFIIKKIVLLPNCRYTFPVTIIMVSINQDLSFPEARNQISNEKGIYWVSNQNTGNFKVLKDAFFRIWMIQMNCLCSTMDCIYLIPRLLYLLKPVIIKKCC